MSTSKRVLGRGLGALLKGTSDSGYQNQVQHIELSRIVPNPFQPRRSFTPESVQELAESIKKNDLIQPIVIRFNAHTDQYEIVTGERRFRAFNLLNKENIPAIIREFNDQEMLVNALIENIQREDLSPLEESHSYQKLIHEFSLTHEDLANTVSKSRSHISNSLRLLKLPDAILDYLESGLITPGAARALLPLPSVELQRKVASEVIVQGMNVRQIERYVKEILSKDATSVSNKTMPPSQIKFHAEEETLKALTGLQCSIKSSRKGHRLEIQFNQTEDLQNFIDQLKALS